jgi:hypothetical protein
VVSVANQHHRETTLATGMPRSGVVRSSAYRVMARSGGGDGGVAPAAPQSN